MTRTVNIMGGNFLTKRFLPIPSSMKSRLLVIFSFLMTVIPCASAQNGFSTLPITLYTADGSHTDKDGGGYYISSGDSVNPPTMPQLECTVITPGHEGPGPTPIPAKDIINWSLVVTFPKFTYPSTQSKKTTVQFSTSLPAVKSWKIYELFKGDDSFFGGEAILSGMDGTLSGQISFSIVGTNPTEDDAFAYIKAKPNCPRMAAPIAKEESHSGSAYTRYYNQFYTKAMTPHKLRMKGYPTLNGVGSVSDGGYGMFQITLDPVPTRLQIWNWQANVDNGVERVLNNKTVAQNWLAAMNRTYPVSEGYDPLPSEFVPDPFTQELANGGSYTVTPTVPITPAEAYYTILYNGTKGLTLLTLTNEDGTSFEMYSCFVYDGNRSPGNRWVFKDNKNHYAAQVDSIMKD